MLTRTTTALLDGLEDPANEQIWREFDGRFRPILIAFARRLGLSAEDAADAAQETLTRFVGAYRAGRYDRTKGRLRSWVIGIARNCIRDAQQAAMVRGRMRGQSALGELPNDQELTLIWDEECEQELLRRGLVELRRQTKTDTRTIQVFEMLALDGRRASDVAAELTISMNDVYLAKHRCLKRLRGIMSGLREMYEVS
jgi:RNA polymerase sigma-70 factor (ECF subfamily)